MLERKRTTIVLFSGDYDKAMAACIIANGAAAYDHEVTIFHTFQGLNALRKDEPIQVNKNFMEKMFAKMIKDIMKKHKWYAVLAEEAVKLLNSWKAKALT